MIKTVEFVWRHVSFHGGNNDKVTVEDMVDRRETAHLKQSRLTWLATRYMLHDILSNFSQRGGGLLCNIPSSPPPLR